MKIKLFHIIFLLLFSQALFSQANSIEVGQDSIKLSEEKYDRMYKLFVEDRDKEIKHLLKINLIDFGVLNPNIGFEQGLGKHFSHDLYIAGSFKKLDNITRRMYNVSYEIRGYYNYNYREKKGRNINGFSGNYFSLGAMYSREETNLDFIQMSRVLSYTYYGGLIKTGIQRRIGNIGYIDFYLGCAVGELDEERVYGNLNPPRDLHHVYELPSYEVLLGFKAGFAIDSFKNLKYMLK